MEKLKLHLSGKEDYLQELEKEFNQKLKEIENRKMSSDEKEEAIQKLKNEYQKLKRQADFNLF